MLSGRKAMQAESLSPERSSLGHTLSEVLAGLSRSSNRQRTGEIVKTALERLVAAGSADCAHWFTIPELSAGNKYAARSRGLSSIPPFPASSELPWIVAQLEQHRVVVVGRLNELPRDASLDQEVLSARDVKSLVFLPAGYGPERTGVLVLEQFLRERKYPAEFLSQLQMLSGVISFAHTHRRLLNVNRALEQQFRNIFEQPLIGMAFEDMEGRLLQVNPELCVMLGYSPEELLTMRGEQLADPQHSGDDLALFQELREGMRPNYHIEKAYVRKDGRRIWGRLHVCRLASADGEPVRVLAMVEDITERKMAEGRLQEAQVALHELTGRLIQAQEQERQRIARELHDDIGQRLSLLMFEIERISREAPVSSDPQFGSLGTVLERLDELAKDVHQLSHQLHSTKLQHIGLRSALRDLCRQVTTPHGTIVVQQLEDAPDLPSDIQLCLYRVAQEALNNIAKHSRATRAFVRFAKVGGMARLEVRDTGVGFNASNAGAGLGLASMRERLRIVGGNLLVRSKPGKGTAVVASIPLEEIGLNQVA